MRPITLKPGIAAVLAFCSVAVAAPGSSNTVVRITAAFVTAPETTFQTLLKNTDPDTMYDPRSKALQDFIARYPDAKILGTPAIITPDGEQGTVEMLRAVPFNGTNAEVGIILTVKPTVILDGAAAKLEIRAESRELVDGRIKSTVLETTLDGVYFENVAPPPPDPITHRYRAAHGMIFLHDKKLGELFVTIAAESVDPSALHQPIATKPQ